jgi:hypothetical protein
MTPMTSRVADAQENRFAGAAGFIEGLLVPGAPIHRIMLVLEQVRGLLAGQTVRMARGDWRISYHGIVRFACVSSSTNHSPTGMRRQKDRGAALKSEGLLKKLSFRTVLLENGKQVKGI